MRGNEVKLPQLSSHRLVSYPDPFLERIVITCVITIHSGKGESQYGQSFSPATAKHFVSTPDDGPAIDSRRQLALHVEYSLENFTGGVLCVLGRV